MRDFYGEETGALPCVICDTAYSVMFANRTAYAMPVTLRWIEKGRAEFTEAFVRKLEAAFDGFGAIVKLSYRTGGKRYEILADRVQTSSACFYVFSLIKSGEDAENAVLINENGGRRLITACFTPRTSADFMQLASPGALFDYWCHRMLPLLDEEGIFLEYSCTLSDWENGAIRCEPLFVCVTAMLSAICGVAYSSTVALDISERKGGFTFKLSATISNDTVIAETSDVSASFGLFASRLPQIILAERIARESGFRFFISSDGNAVEISLEVDNYDPGEVGFKAQSEVYSNANTCISAAQELLF